MIGFGVFDSIRQMMFGCLVLVSLTSCTSLPDRPHTQASIALTQQVHSLKNQDQTTSVGNHLSQAIGEQTAKHPSLSGYYPIATGANAFAARSILADMATKTIDVQYYIWHNDEAGQLMLKDLWEAAERGVLVRFLLDDFNNNPKLDELLAHFDAHPNIAVRLVNPASQRRWRFVNFLTNPQRMNRRMHNKSMTFDGRISILGGRNIGNEYLNNGDQSQFADLDVLLIGPVVADIAKSFDDYWDAGFSYDIGTLMDKPQGDFLSALEVDVNRKQRASEEEQALRTYRQAVADSTIGQDLLNKQLAFRWAVIDFLADDAKKLQGDIGQEGLLVSKLRQKLGTPTRQFSVVSSYFVPTDAGTKGLIDLANQGVKINILTNSYDATDVGAVHSGYAHHRKSLLKSGIRLYELKSTARRDDGKDNKLWRTRGRTTTSLHAKAFAIDGHKVFIGSYNVDPRSANINSELGVLIYDNRLASRLHDAFSDTMKNQAYEVILNDGKLQWHTIENGQEQILDNEPNMHLSDKLGVAALYLLPIDWLL